MSKGRKPTVSGTAVLKPERLVFATQHATTGGPSR